MKKALIIILIIALCLLIVGGIVFTSVMSKNNWNFNILSNVEMTEQHYSVQASEVTEIEAKTATLRITYMQTEGDQITVDYYLTKTKKKGEIISEFHPAVNDGKLIVKEETTSTSWFNHAFYNFDDDEDYGVVIKVPAAKEMTINLKSDTGRIVLGEEGKEIVSPAVTLSTDTGRIVINGNVTCAGNVSAETDTGRIVANGRILCAGDFSCKTDTGRIVCENDIEAKNVSMRSDTGRMEIKKSLKTEKLNLIGETGDVRCSGIIEANDVSIETDTGDVTLTVKGAKEDYSYIYSSSTGKSNVATFTAGTKNIRVKTDTGDITLTFGE